MNASIVSMCTSSIMYTLFLRRAGGYCTSSLSVLMSSIPLSLAASISTTSVAEPRSIMRQLSQTPQGSPSFGSSQLTAFASIFAQEVLPVPLEPQKR